MSSKGFLALLVVLCLAMSFCACGNEAAPEQTTAATVSTTAQTDPAPTEDGKIDYTVKVVDANGTPIAGAAVQLCSDSSCMPPVMTDAEGISVFRAVEADGYKISFMTLPEGYTAEAEAFYFESGSSELTITLSAA